MLSALEISVIVAIMALSITKIVAVYIQNTPSPFPRREDITPINVPTNVKPINLPKRKPFPHEYALSKGRNIETFFRIIEKRMSR